MNPKLILCLTLMWLTQCGALALSVINRLQPATIGDTPYSVKVDSVDFGVQFTVFYRTNGYTSDRFLHARLEICDEDHRIASSAVEKTWITNGVQFEFTISPAYLSASKFTIVEMAHAGDVPMPGIDARWFYLRDFATNHSAAAAAKSSNVVSPDIISALPARIRALPAGTAAGDVWNKLQLASYKGRLGGMATDETERYWLDWNHELELTFQGAPTNNASFDWDKRKLIRATLFKNGLEISTSSK